ncbi:MAG TPA: hypothetical protein VK251_05035 [Steroidobacteraceae bacterium]|nr:hypothetical protein [Steroidobacteraceae bacterium]
MLALNRFLIAAVFCMLAGTPAFAGSGLTITISNDSNDTLLVSVYDLNATSPQKVLSNEVVSGNASVTVAIAADDQGHGHVSWTARTSDSDMRMCGRDDAANLNDGDSVSVHADTDCN